MLERIEHNRQGRDNRLELQGDIGNGSDHGNQADKACHLLAFAVTRGNKIGNRSDIL